uniref:Transmembrane glycoprotein NMB n=1 Tax=Petromyzon marinus TaxID=7757 RepID=A0AAJ7TKH6_PETMA|nr:transmembrane glycoprotein NMB [Petromyzon marinus]
MEPPVLYLASLLLCLGVVGAHSGRRFSEVVGHRGRWRDLPAHASLGDGWMSTDSSYWDEDRYPIRSDNGRDRHRCWPMRNVTVNVTNDGPTLVGSKLTVSVTIISPWHGANGTASWNHTYDGQAAAPGEWPLQEGEEDHGEENWSHDDQQSNTFPNGKPFHRDRHRQRYLPRLYVYIWSTEGKYYTMVNGNSSNVTIDTTDIPVGTHNISLLLYRGGQSAKQLCAIANVTDNYTVTDSVPLSVKISQMGDRNSSDLIFLENAPVSFTATPHDPSGYLGNATLTYAWNFGDGTEVVVGPNASVNHTYSAIGSFNMSLWLRAVIPTPCGTLNATVLPPDETGPWDGPTGQPGGAGATVPDGADLQQSSTKSPPTPSPTCQLVRYGSFTANVTIVEGISSVAVVALMPSVVTMQGGGAVDFMVTCSGSLPSEVCTVVSDEACVWPVSGSCRPLVLAAGDPCSLTLREQFNGSGIFCLNVSLADAVSLAVVSTYVDFNAESTSAKFLGPAVFFAGIVPLVLLGLLFYKKYRQYTPVAPPGMELSHGPGTLDWVKFIRNKSGEKNPLLNAQKQPIVAHLV